jgi:hypothetical protein
MAKKGETEKEHKSNYGKIIYKNFAKIRDTEIMDIIILSVIISFIILWSFTIISIFILEPIKSTLEIYIILIGGLVCITFCCIVLIKKIDDVALNQPGYSLFDNGILRSGFKSNKNGFIHFKDLISVCFNHYGQMMDKSEFKFYYNNNTMQNRTELESRQKGDKIKYLSVSSFVIEDKYFKDITKFRHKILPLLDKYQIEFIEN